MLERGWQDRVRGAARRDAAGAAALQPRRAALGCPSCGHGITAAARTFRSCRGSCCAASARPAARRSPPAIRSSSSWAACSRPAPSGASARRGKGSPRAGSCGRCSRSRSSTSTRSSCPTTSRCRCCGRAWSSTLLRPVRAAARRGHRRDRGLSGAVGDLLAVQADPRQGRHGLRRLQAAGRARRVARLADAAADRPAVVGRRRVHRHHAGRVQGPRPQHSARLRSVSRDRRRDRAVLRPSARARPSCPA